MRAKKTAALIPLFILLFPLKSFAGISPAENFKWDYKGFCGNTVPSYVDAYKDGEKEIIIMSLQSSDSFKKLKDDQKKAFLRLLEYFSLKEKNGASLNAIKAECQESLDRALDSTRWDNHRFCRDAAFKAAEIIGEDRSTPEFKELSGLAYRKCMTKIIEKGSE